MKQVFLSYSRKHLAFVEYLGVRAFLANVMEYLRAAHAEDYQASNSRSSCTSINASIRFETSFV